MTIHFFEIRMSIRTVGDDISSLSLTFQASPSLLEQSMEIHPQTYTGYHMSVRVLGSGSPKMSETVPDSPTQWPTRAGYD